MAWTVTALPAALGAIFVCQLATREWRDALLRAFVWLGLLVTLISEGLGAIGALSRIPLFIAWCAVVLAASRWGFARWRIRDRPVLRRPGLSALDIICLVGIAGIIAIVGSIAWISPPNTFDAMAYHLPRVIYWSQERSVSFFPTAYYNQIMLQPLAEYFMLHTFVLSGGDHWVNLVQWLGMLGSVVAVSSIARLLGAGVRGQVTAALFCATLPNGILQASGANNDCFLALWLVALAYFALRFAAEQRRDDLVYCAAALGLALFTKATAYLYAPGVLLAICIAAWPKVQARRLAVCASVLCAAILLINGPQYLRNIDLSGSPLGFDSAHGDGLFRWRNEAFGWKQTASNALRNVADQLGARSEAWNRGVYRSVVRVHEWMHAGVNDPATTWRWSQYEPPRNTNHEANANNRWHLLILACSAIALALSRRTPSSPVQLCYAASVLLGFLLFCFYLKWQPFGSRLLLPLFALGAPLAGAAIESLRPSLLQWLICLFLLNNARPYLFENWIRPLKGPNSIRITSRAGNYFSEFGQWNNQDSYWTAVDLVSRTSCQEVGIDIHEFQLEYPFQALMRERKPSVQFVHTGVNNASAKYAARQSAQPCAVLCLNCVGKPARLDLYKKFPRTFEAGQFAILFR